MLSASLDAQNLKAQRLVQRYPDKNWTSEKFQWASESLELDGQCLAIGVDCDLQITLTLQGMPRLL